MNIEVNDLSRRVEMFAALGDPMRLRIVDALSLSDLSPSEIQHQVGAASNLVAHHLAVLEGAGLVERIRSEGDRRRSYVRLRQGVLDGILPDGSAEASRVVFVCTANSARSQLAAALWSSRSDIPAISAGTHPANAIAVGAVGVAERRGLKLVAAQPVALADVAHRGDFIVTVCDSAHEELADSALHWSIPDPVRDGSDAVFDEVFDVISARVDDLAPRLRRAS